MSTFPTELCRSCRAAIIWAVTINGRRMPVDAEPAGGGCVKLTDRRHLSQPPLAEVLAAAKRFGRTDLRSSHFTTCPQGAAWRQSRRAAS